MSTPFSLRGAPALAVSIALLSTATFARADEVKLSLSGAQETPPVMTTATATGSLTFGADKSVSGTIKTSGMDGTMAHVHVGAPGTSGPPIITLTKGADGTWSIPAGTKLTDEQYASYKAGNLYVNVHSAEHKPGEIRAQIKP